MEPLSVGATETYDAPTIESPAEGRTRGAIRLKGASREMVESMTESRLEDIAATKRKCLPERKA
ncbi:MAG: DUF3008 family protein [Novosphingobium sp.]